jgi:transposase
MEVVNRRCAGLDVHKKSISACVLITGPGEGQAEVEKGTFGTFTSELMELKNWLRSRGVTHVVMESTGVYWIPVWNLLEDAFDLLLVNPQHFRAVPGRKTDQKDCEWLAQLLQYGLLRGSFVPPQEIRELRELTRYRVKLLGQRNQMHNRIEKLLQQANVKLSSVATDILGVTGRSILRELLRGNQDVESLADCAKGTLRRKKAELTQALQARITEHQRFMLHAFMEDLEFVEGKIARIEETIRARMAPHEEVMNRLNTIPGVNQLTASTLIAELGVQMQQFPDAMHLASWAGLCPGDCESAGKRKNTRTRKGNPHVRRVLCQAAWAAAHTKHTYLAALFYRIASKGGRKKALIAVARHLIVITYHLIREPLAYRDLGANYFDALHAERTKRRLIRRLEDLGHEVTLNPKRPATP